MTPLEIHRGQALAHRLRALDLAGPGSAPGSGDVVDLGVLDLGVQDTPPGSARLSIATRLGAERDPFADDRIAMAWTTRGSPHVHRARDLPTFADALWPLSDKDAVARLGGGGKALAGSGMAPLDGFAIAVEGMAEVVTSPMTKPEASAALTRHLPDELSGFCEPCGSVHVYEMLFRCAALAAGVGIVAGQRPLTLAPIEGWAGSSPDPQATVDVAERVPGPPGPGHRRRRGRLRRHDRGRGARPLGCWSRAGCRRGWSRSPSTVAGAGFRRTGLVICGGPIHQTWPVWSS